MMLGLRHSAPLLSRISAAVCKPAERISLQLHPRSYGVSRISKVFGVTTDQPSPMPSVLQMSPSRRWKSRKNRSKDVDDDESSDDEDDRGKNKEELDWTLGKDSKVVTLSVPSLRTDLILKSSLNMARNKIETLFYESKIRVNGKKLMKKSNQVYIGDEIDVVRGPSPDNPARFILVTRVEILGAVQKDEDRLSVRVRRFPKLTIEDELSQQEQPSA